MSGAEARKTQHAKSSVRETHGYSSLWLDHHQSYCFRVAIGWSRWFCNLLFSALSTIQQAAIHVSHWKRFSQALSPDASSDYIYLIAIAFSIRSKKEPAFCQKSSFGNNIKGLQWIYDFSHYLFQPVKRALNFAIIVLFSFELFSKMCWKATSCFLFAARPRCQSRS